MADTNIKKNADGYGYKYTDLSEIHNYLETNNMRYYQYIETHEGQDYVVTVPIIEGKELPPRRGCRVVQATLQGIKNPAQEQGSALTYARRYSVLMAFGLATTDDDAKACEKAPEEPKKKPQAKKGKTTAAAPELATQDDKKMLVFLAKNVGWTSDDIIKLAGLKDGEQMTKAMYHKVKEEIKKKQEEKDNE